MQGATQDDLIGTTPSAVRHVCPVCRRPPRPLEGAVQDAWLCPACGHTFVGRLPSVEELKRAYERYNYAAPERELPAFLDALVAEMVSSFEPHRTHGRILDVGFGDGGVMKVAKRLGWDTHGIEFSPEAVAAARARGLGTITEGDFCTADIAGAPFDVVVMSELIEHVLDPPRYLRRAAEVLRPGGLLYLTTPNGRGVSGRVLRASWTVLAPPEHIQLFSVQSMRSALRDAGFTKPVVYTQGVHPHELIAHFRRRLSRNGAPKNTRVAADFNRTGKGQELNARLQAGPVGRTAKRAANGLIRLSGVGDGLKVRAVR